MQITCAECGAPFRAKRADARLCSARCRKAASRGAGAVQDGDVTDKSADSAHLAVTGDPDVALGAVIDLGRLAGDTIAERRWRIVVADGFTLQCDALVPGGWMAVATEPTLPVVRRFGARLGLSIDPLAIGAQPELLVA